VVGGGKGGKERAFLSVNISGQKGGGFDTIFPWGGTKRNNVSELTRDEKPFPESAL